MMTFTSLRQSIEIDINKEQNATNTTVFRKHGEHNIWVPISRDVFLLDIKEKF
jgi:hypothetical protein